MEADDDDLEKVAIAGFIPLLRFFQENFPTARHAIVTSLLVVKVLLEAAGNMPSLLEMAQWVADLKIDPVSKEALLAEVDKIITEILGKLGEKKN